MKHRLFIIEGLPSSGKSVMADYIAVLLKKRGNVCSVDEGTGDHPADYEFHAIAPAGLLSQESQVVALSEYSGDMLEKLLVYKIYDALPWETEMPLMLDKWRHFVRHAEENTVYVFNCVLLQNPMCETMMRFGFDEMQSRRYIEQIVRIIEPLDPVVFYLKNDDIVKTVLKTAQERPGWLDAVVDYHMRGAYGKSIAAVGFDGYIRCLKERQRRELRILSRLPVKYFVIENAQRDWKKAKEQIQTALEEMP